MEDHEVNRLLNQLIEGSIGGEEFARLQEILRRDPAARLAYYELLGIDQLLAERYEVPDHIAVQSQAMDQSWAVNRAKRRVIAWSLVGAAAAIVLTLGAVFFGKPERPEVTLQVSADSSLLINGADGNGRALKPGDAVQLNHGVVSLELTPYVEACLEGPARLRLRDRAGNVDLLEGSAFFQVLPGGRGLQVHTPAGIVHDIGTRFGVKVTGDQVETHVVSGAVDIEPRTGAPRHRVAAGEAARWSPRDAPRTMPMEADRFVQSLPWQQVLFSDDFSDPDGTTVTGKEPDTGMPWAVFFQVNRTTIERGILDTSFGPRALRAGFVSESSSERRRVYLTTFTTAVPQNIRDKSWMPEAAESLSLRDGKGTPVFSIFARASRDHLWQLKDEQRGTLSTGTQVSALTAATLTLSYEPETGRVRLFDGSGTQGQLLDELKVRAGASLGSLTVSNAEGGDLAIDRLDVRVVTYPQQGGTGE